MAGTETMTSLPAHAVRPARRNRGGGRYCSLAVIATFYATLLPTLDFQWALGIDAHASDHVAK